MIHIVTTTYRCKRPPKKRKAVALDAPAAVAVADTPPDRKGASLAVACRNARQESQRMPRSKHRRKTDGKLWLTQAAPRTQSCLPYRARGRLEVARRKARLPRALPLFDWADADANRNRLP